MVGLEQAKSGSEKRVPSSSLESRRFTALLTRLRSGTNGAARIPSLIGVISSHRSKSTPLVATQLAGAAAAEMGLRTLALDISGPSSLMARLLDAPATPGVTDLLGESCSVEECQVDELAGGGLSLIPWGSLGAEAIGPHQVQRFSELLDQLRSSFELVVVALPPATETSPGTPLAACLEGVLLVIDSEDTQISVAQRAHELLKRADVRVFGAIMNNCREYLPNWLKRRL